MIKPKIIIVADTILHDKITNKISIINIHENFKPTGYPLLIPRFSVFALLERDLEDLSNPEASLIIKLDDEKIFDKPVEVNFGDFLLTRAIIRFQGFVITKPGILTLTLKVATETINSYPILVEPGNPPNPEQIDKDSI
jgi:hypothetical protein